MDDKIGLSVASGCSQLARDAMNHIEVNKRQCLAKIDVSNAFGTVSRSRVLETVESTGNLVGPLVRRWLGSKQFARVAISHDENLLLPTQTGVPQGDPLSAVLYSLTYGEAVQRAFERPIISEVAEQLEEPTNYWAYIDDLTIGCHPRLLPRLQEALQHELQEAGLGMNAEKTQVYLPQQAHFDTDEAFEAIWQQSGSHEGMIAATQ